MGTDALDHKSFIGFGKRKRQQYVNKYESEMNAYFKNRPEIEKEAELHRKKVNADRERLGLTPLI